MDGLSHSQSLAEAASVSHLILFSRSEGTALAYDSLIYLRKYKGLPSIKAIRGYLGGFFDSKFQPKFRNKCSHRDGFGPPELMTSNTTKQPESQQPIGSALVPNQGEAFEIPANDGQFVIQPESTDIEHETVPPTQAELINDLVHLVNQIDNDKVFVDDALRSQLEPFQHQLEKLSDLAKPI